MRWVVRFVIMLMLAAPVHAAILYVDKDQACPGNGSTGTPYCTIQRALDVVNPGDTVRIRDSATPYNESATLSRSGTVGSPIILEPDIGHTPVWNYTGSGAMTGALNLSNTQYITVQNLTWDGTNTFTSRFAVQLTSPSTNVLGFRFLNNTIKHWGGSDAQANVASLHIGLYLNGSAIGPSGPAINGALIQGNVFDDVRSRSIQLAHANNTIIELNEIKNARCARDGDNAINTVGVHIFDANGYDSTGTIVRNNTIHDFVSRAACGIANAGSYDTMAGVWCDVGSSSGEVSGNRIYNLDAGDSNAGNHISIGIHIEFHCFQWRVLNNVVYNIGYYGLSQRTYGNATVSTWTEPGNQFLNNTVYNVKGMLFAGGYGKLIVKNNIFYGTNASKLIGATGVSGQYTIDYNLYFDPSGDTHTGFWDPNAPTSLATWRTQCNCDAHSLFANPVFVNTTTGQEDLHLQVTSPGRGSGEGGLDMGAYISAPATLTPPTNLRVVP